KMPPKRTTTTTTNTPMTDAAIKAHMEAVMAMIAMSLEVVEGQSDLLVTALKVTS
nr:hypothetical protein [Tanacetum cinerariifolium]